MVPGEIKKVYLLYPNKLHSCIYGLMGVKELKVIHVGSLVFHPEGNNYGNIFSRFFAFGGTQLRLNSMAPRLGSRPI